MTTKMASLLSSAVRIRLIFDYPPPFNPECRMCWLFVDLSKCRVVTDLISIIRQRFGFSRNLLLNLFIDECLLLPEENIYIVRDNDSIRVKLEETAPILNGLYHAVKKDKTRNRYSSVEEDLSEGNIPQHKKKKKRKRDESVSNADERSGTELPSARSSKKRKKNKDKIKSSIENTDGTQTSEKTNICKITNVEINKDKKKREKESLPAKSGPEKGKYPESSSSSGSKAPKRTESNNSSGSKARKRTESNSSGNKAPKRRAEGSKKVTLEPGDSSSTTEDSSDEGSSGKNKTFVALTESKVASSSSETAKKGLELTLPMSACAGRTVTNSPTASDASSSSSGSENTVSNKMPVSSDGLYLSGSKIIAHGNPEQAPSSQTDVCTATRNAQISPASSRSSSDELVIKKPKPPTETTRTKAENGKSPFVAGVRGQERETSLNVGRGRGRGEGIVWRGPRGRGPQVGGRGRAEGRGSQFYFDYNRKQPQKQENTISGSSVTQTLPEAPKRDYGLLPLLAAPPQMGQRIAFKILRLTDNYTPELSEYKEGKIVDYDAVTQQIKLEVLSAISASKEPGKFDLVYHSKSGAQVIEYAVSEDSVITERWDKLVEPRLIVETAAYVEQAAS